MEVAVETLKDRIRDLEAVLSLKDDNLIGTFKLPPQLAKLMGLLVSVPNVTPEMVERKLSICANAKVAIGRLRTHLDAWARDRKQEPIEICSRRGVGYWLDDQTKDRVKALVTPQVN